MYIGGRGWLQSYLLCIHWCTLSRLLFSFERASFSLCPYSYSIDHPRTHGRRWHIINFSYYMYIFCSVLYTVLLLVFNTWYQCIVLKQTTTTSFSYRVLSLSLTVLCVWQDQLICLNRKQYTKPESRRVVSTVLSISFFSCCCGGLIVWPGRGYRLAYVL